MKIICTIKEKQNLHKVFNQWADIPKVHGYCPFAFIYCSKIPLCDIEKDKCRECIKDHIEWEIIDEEKPVKEDVFTRKEELSKAESEWLIDFITKEGGPDCMDEDAKQASIPYSYQMPKDYIKNKLDYSRTQGDLISRKFVNEVVCAEFVDLQDGTEEWRSYVNDTCENILKKIDNAPSVGERPQGEWGNWIIAEIQCPNCFEYFETDCYSTGELNKCPNCGADMRGGEEE